jgi:hypothetical protein
MCFEILFFLANSRQCHYRSYAVGSVFSVTSLIFFRFPPRLRASAVQLVLGFSVLSPCLRASVVGLLFGCGSVALRRLW